MTVRAIVPADYPACVVTWNRQAALFAAQQRIATWTAASMGFFLGASFAHRIDDANGTFAVLTWDEVTDEYELVGGITRLVGLARVMKALAALIPPDAQIRGDVPQSAAKAVRSYFTARYSQGPGDPDQPQVTRYRGTAQDIEVNA